jgi:muramoyltetrapeptide carboxypeptidase
MLIKPRKLVPGDVVGIVSPASAPPDPRAIDKSVEALEKLGFKPKLAANARERWGFLAGNDRERAGDIMKMFNDKRVHGIICVRGGYGTARLLPLLDFKAIRANPKVFIGYSDITSLHMAFLNSASLISFHGPMLNSDFIKPDMPEPTLRSFRRTLGVCEAPGSICQGFSRDAIRAHRKGKVTGRLIGGNLTLFCASLGTPWQANLKNSVFFFEDLDEVPYRFDRLLTQLLNAGVLQQAVGIAVGINKGCEDPKRETAGEYRQSLEDVLKERLLPLKVPLVSGLPFGHIPENATLPVGVRATLDANKGDLIIEEAAVRE